MFLSTSFILCVYFFIPLLVLMNSKIQKIIAEIELQKKELQKEYENMFQDWMKTYDFYIQKGKIVFSQKAKIYQRNFKQGILKYIFTARFRHLLSIPFIYGMIFPAFFLDFFLFIYQHVCFRLYGIPRVKKTD